MPVISGGNVVQPGGVLVQEFLITEDSTNTTYTASATIPAGSFLVDVIVHGVAVWTAATSATAIVGDVADDNGIFTGIDLKATDLLAGEGLSAAGVAGTAGGKAGADLANSQWNRRWLATERVISMIVTKSGAGTAGRTRFAVIYTDPTTVINATASA